MSTSLVSAVQRHISQTTTATDTDTPLMAPLPPAPS